MTEKHYFVRSCRRNPDGKLESLHSDAKGFVWPEEVGSVVTCPDWDPHERCGGGLHGLRPGDDDPGMWANEPNAVWMICSYDPATAVVLKRKIKVPSCVVEYVVDLKNGAPFKVPQWLRDHGVAEPIYRGVDIDLVDSCIPEVHRHIKVGAYGYAISHRFGVSEAGWDGTAIAGGFGKASAGVSGMAIVGDYGTAFAGMGGKAQAGNGGTAIATNYGRAIAGYLGKAQAGIGGIIQIEWITKDAYPRIATGYIGQDGLEPNVLYMLDLEGHFVKAGDND